MCACVSVWVCSRVCRCPQKPWSSDPLELELQVPISCLMLWSCAKEIYLLPTEPSPSTHSLPSTPHNHILDSHLSDYRELVYFLTHQETVWSFLITVKDELRPWCCFDSGNKALGSFFYLFSLVSFFLQLYIRALALASWQRSY